MGVVGAIPSGAPDMAQGGASSACPCEPGASLKRAAVQYGVAVVAGAQLVDPPAWIAEHRRSQGAAVRESRAAAHAADMVLEIHPDPDDDGSRGCRHREDHHA